MNTKVVLITGALTGIGRATAVAFAREGAKLVVSGRHDDKGQELAAELRGLGAEAEFVKADVRHEEEVKNLVEITVKRFGRLDIAVNNAGTEGKPGPIVEQTT
jgi:NAD(P)-dependent dehydrogenase (short-subunit alcohol dehydrogenase family)